MKRRHLLRLLVASPMAYAIATRAQPQTGPVVGFLNSASVATYSFNASAFREGLRDAGFTEGRNVTIEYRWADNDYARLPALAGELAQRNVAAIAATGDIASARAAQAATTKIPIVFTVGSDPVSFGLVTSLSRPTGNATGVTLFSSTLMAKRLELLRDAAPNARLVALLMNPDNLNYDVDIKAAREAAQSLGRQTVIVDSKSPNTLAAAFQTISQRRAHAVLIASDPMFLGQREQIAALASKQKLPVVAWTSEFSKAGILMSYGTSIQWMYRQAGLYVGRILKGAKPSELPIIQPTHFQLVINLTTAKALGITIPQSLRLRADDMLE